MDVPLLLPPECWVLEVIHQCSKHLQLKVLKQLQVRVKKPIQIKLKVLILQQMKVCSRKSSQTVTAPSRVQDSGGRGVNMHKSRLKSHLKDLKPHKTNPALLNNFESIYKCSLLSHNRKSKQQGCTFQLWPFCESCSVKLSMFQQQLKQQQVHRVHRI